jgi:hypothetical protein
MKPIKPPSSRLPPGATDWVLLEDMARGLNKDVRTIKLWCDRQLVYVEELAGGVGGRWIAVAEGCWPISNPAGVTAYRQKRSASARVGSMKGAQASAAARAAKKANRQRPSSKRSA